MLVCSNNKISPNECATNSPQDIYTITCTPEQAGSISDVSEPSKIPSYPYNAKISPEEYGLIS